MGSPKWVKTEKINATHFYAITDGGGDQRVDFLSVQKSLVGLFLYHDFDEVLICKTPAGLSYCNPVERVHGIANLGLQSVGIMRQRLPPDMEKLIKNCNSNEEICKSIVNHADLKEAVEKSLSKPIDLLKAVFSKLGLKENTFKIFDAATGAEIEKYELKEDQFDANMTDLSR